MKFRRPRNRRSNTNVNIKNQNFDSSGPTGKIRGTAQQIYEKYTALARDVGTGINSDRILAEKYYQFADHYYRLLLAAREQEERNQMKIQEKNTQNQEQPNYEPSGREEKNKEDEFKKVSASTSRRRPFERGKVQETEEVAVPIADVDFLSAKKEKVEKEEKSLVAKKRPRVSRKKITGEKAPLLSETPAESANIKVMSVD